VVTEDATRVALLNLLRRVLPVYDAKSAKIYANGAATRYRYKPVLLSVSGTSRSRPRKLTPGGSEAVLFRSLSHKADDEHGEGQGEQEAGFRSRCDGKGCRRGGGGAGIQ
jgi:hypothetical protein